jgi:hypothetical protein
MWAFVVLGFYRACTWYERYTKFEYRESCAVLCACVRWIGLAAGCEAQAVTAANIMARMANFILNLQKVPDGLSVSAVSENCWDASERQVAI